MRNSIRGYYLERATVHALLSHETMEHGPRSADDACDIVIRRGDGNVQKVSSGLNVEIVERSVITGGEATIFFVAGQRADSTWGAAEYLVRNWKKLEREFGTFPFVVGLGFPKVDRYPEEYLEPEILVKLQL